MKKLLPLLLFAAAVATGFVIYRTHAPTYSAPKLAEQATIPLQLASQPRSGEALRVFDVAGMCDCGGCRKRIYDVLATLDGVREAAIDDGGVARAIVRSDADVAALEKALSFDKYVAHARP